MFFGGNFKGWRGLQWFSLPHELIRHGMKAPGPTGPTGQLAAVQKYVANWPGGFSPASPLKNHGVKVNGKDLLTSYSLFMTKKKWMSIVELGSWANEPTYLSSGPHIAVETQPFQLPRTPSIPRWSSVWFKWPARVFIPATIWFRTIDIAWKYYRMLIPSAILVQFPLGIESLIWKITIVNW